MKGMNSFTYRTIGVVEDINISDSSPECGVFSRMRVRLDIFQPLP